jgi:hypothetical protein
VIAEIRPPGETAISSAALVETLRRKFIGGRVPGVVWAWPHLESIAGARKRTRPPIKLWGEVGAGLGLRPPRVSFPKDGQFKWFP